MNKFWIFKYNTYTKSQYKILVICAFFTLSKSCNDVSAFPSVSWPAGCHFQPACNFIFSGSSSHLSGWIWINLRHPWFKIFSHHEFIVAVMSTSVITEFLCPFVILLNENRFAVNAADLSMALFFPSYFYNPSWECTILCLIEFKLDIASNYDVNLSIIYWLIKFLKLMLSKACVSVPN